MAFRSFRYLGMKKRRQNLRRSPVLALFSFCVPTPHINNDRSHDIVLNTLIAELTALGIEHHMTGKVPKPQDFYEFPLCSITTVSTCLVLGNKSTAAAFTAP